LQLPGALKRQARLGSREFAKCIQQPLASPEEASNGRSHDALDLEGRYAPRLAFGLGRLLRQLLDIIAIVPPRLVCMGRREAIAVLDIEQAGEQACGFDARIAIRKSACGFK